MGKRADRLSTRRGPGSKSKSPAAARSRVPAGVDDEQLAPSAAARTISSRIDVLVDPGPVHEPGVVGDQGRHRTSAAKAVQYNYKRSAPVPSAIAPGATPYSMCGPSTALDVNVVDIGGRPIVITVPAPVRSKTARKPRARPHQRSVELVLAAVDREPGNRVLGGAVRGADGEGAVDRERLTLQRERAVGRHVCGIALKASEPVQRAVRDRHLQRVQVRKNGAGSAIGRPGFERRGSGHDGVVSRHRESAGGHLERRVQFQRRAANDDRGTLIGETGVTVAERRAIDRRAAPSNRLVCRLPRTCRLRTRG